MTRRPISLPRRVKLWKAHGGVCHLCGQKISGGIKWHVEHMVPIALGGADDESNMAPAHIACHTPKTKADVAAVARAKRREAKHLGIRPPSKWGSKKWKRKVGGETVLR